MRYPLPLQRLIETFLLLPGVGRRTAIRFAYHIVRSDSRRVKELSQALLLVQQELRLCEKCRQLSEAVLCPICANSSRNGSQLCVVAEDNAITAIEQTGAFQGLYFVLGGTLDPVAGIDATNLPIAELLARIKPDVTEVLLAFDSDTAGETTTSYLKQELRQRANIRITQLARGMATGALLEYADEITLQNAILGRREDKGISASEEQ
ncbi:MAG: recombination mediator RecR [Patescibacteria group bacterium]